MRVAIVGYRSFTNYLYFEQKIKEWESEHGIIDEIVSGGATGADRLAVHYAEKYNRIKRIYPADWKKYGKTAGPIRNNVILNDKLDALIAFPSSKSVGTHDIIGKATKLKIPVYTYPVK